MRHVVALSGGKDSVAMALRLSEVNPDVDYDYLITPTGNELPMMEEHWARVEEIIGKKMIRLTPFPDDGLAAVIHDQNMIPNFRARFCTRILKIEPCIQWLVEHAPCVQYVGLRADEEERKGLFGDMEGVTQAYPLRDWGWGIDDVWNYLDEKGISIPERTDCAWCFFQRLIEWKRLWLHERELFDKGAAIEEEMGYTFRSAGRDTWPADLKGLGEEFARGRKVRGEDKYNQKLLVGCDREALCRVCSM